MLEKPNITIPQKDTKETRVAEKKHRRKKRRGKSLGANWQYIPLLLKTNQHKYNSETFLQ